MTDNTFESLPKNKRRSARALEAMTAPENATLNDKQIAELLGESFEYIYNLRWRNNHPDRYVEHNRRSVLNNKLRRRAARMRELAKQRRELKKQLDEQTAQDAQMSLPLTQPKERATLMPKNNAITVAQMRKSVSKIVDMVNNPAHYTKGGIETIAFIKAKLSREEYIGYLRGNVLKYSSRLGDKDAVEQDAGKLAWYSRELADFLKEGK